MAYQYEYECPTCPDFVFEQTREIRDRNRLAVCPQCGNRGCKKIVNLVRFNTIFQGSTRAQDLADYYTKLSLEAQSEGFRSKDELDTAIGLAAERAKQMGTPGKQLIGPVDSPFKGEKFVPSKDEVVHADNLVKEKIKAAHGGDQKKVQSADRAMKEHESFLKGKAKKSQEFKPDKGEKELKKAIKHSQELRGKALS